MGMVTKVEFVAKYKDKLIKFVKQWVKGKYEYICFPVADGWSAKTTINEQLFNKYSKVTI